MSLPKGETGKLKEGEQNGNHDSKNGKPKGIDGYCAVLYPERRGHKRSRGGKAMKVSLAGHLFDTEKAKKHYHRIAKITVDGIDAYLSEVEFE
jgi:hypothetical protein